MAIGPSSLTPAGRRRSEGVVSVQTYPQHQTSPIKIAPQIATANRYQGWKVPSALERKRACCRTRVCHVPGRWEAEATMASPRKASAATVKNIFRLVGMALFYPSYRRWHSRAGG